MKFDQLILRKIIKIVVTRCQILTLKCTKIDFGWGSAPDPAGGAYSAPPDPLAGFKGPTSKGREGKGTGREGRGGKGREGEAGEDRGHSTCLPPRFDNPGYGPGGKGKEGEQEREGGKGERRGKGREGGKGTEGKGT